MTVPDVALVVDLWVASWAEAMPDIDFEERRCWIATFLADPKHRTFVAESAARLAGFVSLEGAHLHQLVVASRAKGGGTAKSLLDRAKRETPGGLTLDVNQANGRAVRFYEREGFVRTAEGANPTSGRATWAMRWRAP